MKILHVYRTCYPVTFGGLEQVIRCITRGVQSHGVESRILSLSDSEDGQMVFENTEITLKKKQIEIASNGFSLGLLREFRKQAKWADVIHYHYPWPTGDLLSFLDGGTPRVVSYHSDIVRQKTLKRLYAPLERWFLSRVDRIVAATPNYVETSETLQRYLPKVQVIPYGLAPSDNKNVPQAVCDSWEEKVGSGFFLFVGVLRYYKGLTYLMEAAKLTGLPIVIAGDGPLRDELHKMKLDNDLNNVHFVGRVEEDDKYALLKLSRAFVFPSHLRSEAFGISLLEAQQCSKPLITCEVGGGSSYVNADGETGLIVEAANGEAFGAAMQTLADDDALCETMGAASRARFDTLFTEERMAERYAELYRELAPTAE